MGKRIRSNSLVKFASATMDDIGVRIGGRWSGWWGEISQVTTGEGRPLTQVGLPKLGLRGGGWTKEGAVGPRTGGAT